MLTHDILSKKFTYKITICGEKKIITCIRKHIKSATMVKDCLMEYFI